MNDLSAAENRKELAGSAESALTGVKITPSQVQEMLRKLQKARDALGRNMQAREEVKDYTSRDKYFFWLGVWTGLEDALKPLKLGEDNR